MAEGISVHNYGPYNNNVDATLLAKISDIPAFATNLATRLAGTGAVNAASGAKAFINRIASLAKSSRVKDFCALAAAPKTIQNSASRPAKIEVRAEKAAMALCMETSR